MKKIAAITGEIVGWIGNRFVIKNSIKNFNEGFLEIYSETLDFLSRRDEVRVYSKVALGDDFILFQEDDPDNIYVLNPSEMNAEVSVVKGAFYLDYHQYEGNYIVIIENDRDVQYFYLEVENLSLIPSGFKIVNIFNYTHNGYGIRYYNSCIYCYSLETKELVWKISTPEMQYDRGGRHMASATPDNDVPNRCYFMGNLLIAVFESHSAGIELTSGRIVWENNLGSFISSDFLDNGILYVNRFGLFYQLDASTGRLLYERDLYADGNILHYDITTDMVYNDEHIYFCMTRRKTLVTLRKDTFELVSEEKLPDAGNGLLYANTTTYLRGNKLFLTLSKEPLTSFYETLVYEV